MSSLSFPFPAIRCRVSEGQGWQFPQSDGHGRGNHTSDIGAGLGALDIPDIKIGNQGPALSSAKGSIQLCPAIGSGRWLARYVGKDARVVRI